MKRDVCQELASYVEALRPLIYINHFDFEKIDRLIENSLVSKKIYEYTNAFGSVEFKYKNPITARPTSLQEFLGLFMDKPQDCALVLKDVHCHLDNPEVISCLKMIAQRTIYLEDYNIVVIIVSTQMVIPDELEKLITFFDIPCPDNEEILEILNEYTNTLCVNSIDDEAKLDLIQSFKGLSEFEIRQILNLAYQKSGTITRDDKYLIFHEKEQIIKKSGMLELVHVREDDNHIGGLDELQEYLHGKAKIFRQLGEAKSFGVDSPKGVLIVGMPGCGKSLTAKVSAKMFNVPLLRLDVGKLMGKYVGESEGNLRKAIGIADAVAPCVLWVDELEKAFAGIGGSGGGGEVTTRLFGNFLTWLQEKESSVYVVATSNDISKLPAEFLRKGRFDEIFFVELPNAEERKAIFDIHLRKRNQPMDSIRTIQLLKCTEGYSGADIESVVKEAIEYAFINNTYPLTTKNLLDVIDKTTSMSVTLKEKIKIVRDNMQKFGARSASKQQ